MISASRTGGVLARIARPLLVFLNLAGCALGPDEPRPTLRVQGYVLALPDRVPIPGARVELRLTDWNTGSRDFGTREVISALADSTGYYELSYVTSNRATWPCSQTGMFIRATAPGFQATDYGWDGPRDQSYVRCVDAHQHVSFELSPVGE